MAVVVALDAGTTGVRALALSEAGAVAGWAYKEFTQHFPRPGWVEHDAEEIWQAAAAVLAELASKIAEPVAAIGITNQRETAVIWDKRTGEPLAPAIVWQDRRTAARCEELEANGHLPLIRETTGLVLDPYFSATKFAWQLERCDTPREHLALGTVDAWLLWQLTNGEVFATEASNASRTMLFDIGRREWSHDLCELFGVPMGALPEVLPSSGIFGYTAERGTAESGSAESGRAKSRTAASSSPLGAGIPISGIAGDQQAALFGQACFASGDVKNTYGTGSFVLMNIGDASVSKLQSPSQSQGGSPPVHEGLLTSVGWDLSGALGGDADCVGSASTSADSASMPADSATSASGSANSVAYVLEGAIFITGAAVQWLRDGLGMISEASELEGLALQCEDSGGCVLVPAFAGLASPWWDAEARGSIFGLTSAVGPPQLARAVIASMSYQTKDVVRAMEAASGHKLSSLRVDGGASAMNLLLQHQADSLGAKVLRPTMTETTARGAAWLAGLGAGVWASLDELKDQWELDTEVSPASEGDPREQELWHRAVQRTRAFAK